MNRTLFATLALAAIAAFTAGCSPATIDQAEPRPGAAASSPTSPAAPAPPSSTPTPSSSTGTPSSSTATPPSPVPASAPTEPEQEEEVAVPELSKSRFGATAHFSQDGNPFEVTVNKPAKAACRYASLGCDKPETGDRMVNVPMTFKNVGSEQLEVSESLFVLEFADGTRMSSSDGSTYQYGPDNTLGYGTKIRPGGTLKTSLTFEAPDGAYSVVLLTNGFSGEDLHLWQK